MAPNHCLRLLVVHHLLSKAIVFLLRISAGHESAMGRYSTLPPFTCSNISGDNPASPPCARSFWRRVREVPLTQI
jgi:hypothetical protein